MSQRHRIDLPGKCFRKGTRHCVWIGDRLNAALVQQASLAPSLCGSSDLPSRNHDVVLDGVLKARVGDFRICASSERSAPECRSERRVDHTIAFQWTE